MRRDTSIEIESIKLKQIQLFYFLLFIDCDSLMIRYNW